MDIAVNPQNIITLPYLSVKTVQLNLTIVICAIKQLAFLVRRGLSLVVYVVKPHNIIIPHYLCVKVAPKLLSIVILANKLVAFHASQVHLIKANAVNQINTLIQTIFNVNYAHRNL